ncbi:MAG: hypothetical protein JWL77_5748 [Chthonomonadaceae bacterium]|jgi:hypothetical protein|nr:hypothetical protein [Chthonomonadaceae bacterium]
MDCTQSLADWQKRNQEVQLRLLRLASPLDEETLNTHPAASVWSPAQVIAHMVLTNQLYLPRMEAALQNAERVSGDPPVRYSFFGSFLRKVAGPGGNAPAPKPLHPPMTTIPTTIIQEWEQQQIQLLSLMDRAAGVDLSHIRVWNPLVRVIPMNLADCFELLTAHTERHVGQIEERIPR